MKRNRSKTTLREAKAKEPVKPKQEQKPAQTAFTLDGPVISADAPVLQTKTTCPCDGNCPHCKGTVQPKLKGGHNDRDQKETGPIINPLITPGQSGVTADESRKKTVRTKQLSGKTTTPTPGIQNQIQTLKGGGQPLPEATRNYFEPRFGKDLGNIRLHTGTKANDAAATLHAQAFTTGNNVAFGHGHYSPETIAGKKLLAHEITHTIQQQATQNKEETLRLRPQPGPFTVSDIYEKSDKEKDFVFFDWASPDYSDKPPESTLDSKEKQKIFNRKKEAELNQIPVNQIKLIGFASEEGNVNYNLKLIKRRLQAVENVLKNEAGYDKPVKTEEKLSSSKGKLDYRYWRAVEIRFNDETSTRDKQEKGAIVCPMEKQSIVETHRQKAFDMMNNPTKGAMPQLKRYIAKPDPNSTVAAKLDYLFGGDRSKETAIKVLNRINAIDIFLKEISYQTNILCGFPQTPNCKVGSIASTNPETGTIRLCPIFFSKKRKKLAPGTLMHEAAHASVYKTADMAYRNYRAMRILTTEQALDNADSLEEFVYHVYGIGTKVGPKKADKLSGCEKYKESINKTAAVAEHRNLYAVSGTAQTYDHPGNRAYMRPYFYKRFHRADKPAIAGIHDRYRRMYKLFKKQLFINCLKPDNKLCQSGSIVHWPNTRTVNICISPFMKKTPNNRIEHFHAGLARHMPGVTRKQSYAYPKLALDYWRHFWRNDGVQPRKAVDILHEDKYTTKDYKKTVDEWPKEKPIWPYLTQKSAKENYIRYIFNHDLTDCRRYDDKTPIKNTGACKNFARNKEIFENRCKGYAAQIAVRYSTFKRFSKEKLEELKTKAGIYEDNTPAKYQMPVYMATIEGHAFNAVPLGDHLKEIKSYLFYDPIHDTIFFSRDTLFDSYFRKGILTISKLTGYSELGQYLNPPETDFIRGGKGKPVSVELTDTRRIVYTNIARDIFIADSVDTWNTSVIKPKLTYQTYIKKQLDYYKCSDEDLAWVGGYLIGRKYRRSPKAKMETLTRSAYIKLLGRPALEKLIPRERTK